MKSIIYIALIVLLSGCSATATNQLNTSMLAPVDTAGMMLGLNERRDRIELTRLLGVDPVRTEWCAAFVNMILDIHGIRGSNSVSSNPLLAKSFLKWGQPVSKANITRGDIVIFPRGNQGWQGHVGFYVQSMYKNGKEYYVIIGGNQDNTVSVDLYPASKAIAIRRQTSA